MKFTPGRKEKKEKGREKKRNSFIASKLTVGGLLTFDMTLFPFWCHDKMTSNIQMKNFKCLTTTQQQQREMRRKKPKPKTKMKGETVNRFLRKNFLLSNLNSNFRFHLRFSSLMHFSLDAIWSLLMTNTILFSILKCTKSESESKFQFIRNLMGFWLSPTREWSHLLHWNFHQEEKSIKIIWLVCSFRWRKFPLRLTFWLVHAKWFSHENAKIFTRIKSAQTVKRKAKKLRRETKSERRMQ